MEIKRIGGVAANLKDLLAAVSAGLGPETGAVMLPLIGPISAQIVVTPEGDRALLLAFSYENPSTGVDNAKQN